MGIWVKTILCGLVIFMVGSFGLVLKEKEFIGDSLYQN